MRVIRDGVRRLKKDGFIETFLLAIGHIYTKIRNRVISVGPVDRYFYKKSIEELRDRQQLEEDLIGILTVAYGFRGKGLYRSIRPQQEGQELAELAERVFETNPETIVEIGTAQGGTLYTWSRYINSAKTICSIDIGTSYAKRTKFFREFTDESDLVFINQSSQKEATTQEVKQSIDGGIDFLFIDGDHRYDGVKRGFELYSQFMNEGGIIAFHDIVEVDSEYMGVPQL